MKNRKESGLENWVLSEFWCDILRKGGEIFKTASAAVIITRLLVVEQGAIV